MAARGSPHELYVSNARAQAQLSSPAVSRLAASCERIWFVMLRSRIWAVWRDLSGFADNGYADVDTPVTPKVGQVAFVGCIAAHRDRLGRLTTGSEWSKNGNVNHCDVGRADQRREPPKPHPPAAKTLHGHCPK